MSGPLLLSLVAMLAPAPTSQDVAAPTEAPIARLIRLTDPVAKLDGRARAESMLFHWDKETSLRRGDGLRQGVHAASELYFPSDRSVLRLSGETHLVVGLDEGGGRRIDVTDLRRLQADVRDEAITLRLPGGTDVTARGTWFRVTLDPLDRRYVIRNAGPGEVVIGGPVTPLREASVLPGHEVEIPIVQGAGRASEPPSESWEGLRLELTDDVRVERTATGLRLAGTGTARVGGARLHVRPGQAIHVRHPRRPTNIN